jgi:hypothetical protein
MVSTISFIQAKVQHSIAASNILTRTVGVKGTRGTATGTVVSRGLCQRLEYSRIYPVFCGRKGKTTGMNPGKEHGYMDAAGYLLQGPGGSPSKA